MDTSYQPIRVSVFPVSNKSVLSCVSSRAFTRTFSAVPQKKNVLLLKVMVLHSYRLVKILLRRKFKSTRCRNLMRNISNCLLILSKVIYKAWYKILTDNIDAEHFSLQKQIKHKTYFQTAARIQVRIWQNVEMWNRVVVV